VQLNCQFFCHLNKDPTYSDENSWIVVIRPLLPFFKKAVAKRAARAAQFVDWVQTEICKHA